MWHINLPDKGSQGQIQDFWIGLQISWGGFDLCSLTNFSWNSPWRNNFGSRGDSSEPPEPLLDPPLEVHKYTYVWTIIKMLCTRAPDKMRICVFHSNLNVKNSIIFRNVRIMYAKHFPDTQLCSVSKRICFVYILMECGLLPIFP